MAPPIHFTQLRKCITSKVKTLKIERGRNWHQLLSVVYDISLFFLPLMFLCWPESLPLLVKLVLMKLSVYNIQGF